MRLKPDHYFKVKSIHEENLDFHPARSDTDILPQGFD